MTTIENRSGEEIEINAELKKRVVAAGRKLLRERPWGTFIIHTDKKGATSKLIFGQKVYEVPFIVLNLTAGVCTQKYDERNMPEDSVIIVQRNKDVDKSWLLILKNGEYYFSTLEENAEAYITLCTPYWGRNYEGSCFSEVDEDALGICLKGLFSITEDDRHVGFIAAVQEPHTARLFRLSADEEGYSKIANRRRDSIMVATPFLEWDPIFPEETVGENETNE